MSFYEKLNDVKVDVHSYKEIELTEVEKKQWEKRVKNKLKKKNTFSKQRLIGFSAAAVLAYGIMTGTGMVSLASVPFIGGLIENYVSETEELDYTPYKTAIGETAENKLGKITLNEVMIDGGRLLISSTFEPKSDLDTKEFRPLPKVLVDGENLTSTTGGEVIKINESKFTFYNDIELKNLSLGEEVTFNIQYDNLDFEWKVENPWTFEIKVSSETLASTAKTINLDQEVSLENGQTAKLEKLVITPVSSVLYYHMNKLTDYHIEFLIKDQDGKQIPFHSISVGEEGAQIRFKGSDSFNGPLTFVPYLTATKKGKGSIDFYKELPEQSIQIDY
ncbi:DUF4179 domain-containing protein [Bacillus sp. 31A1R]|uniref:DUF4179 domain-containing protein n=1 Tax=Robertmurraya mangrovi TaxID=3098077 RepID=A0ABU5J179_9BACI|nr:DUF4179 domain-containing protein [Bacillus sp. 31A1R]MDZ5473107.1 DUF4179 domain-containing protein [Bacillus sp. 31A1R]